MRRLGSALATATLIGAGGYLFVYLYRWEWNRAMIAGLFMLVAEVALATTAIIGRLRAIEERLDRRSPVPGAATRVAEQLHEHAPEQRDHFAWLRPGGADRLGVFVPVLMGAGALLSGLAWLIERFARHTAGPHLEHNLARRLARIAVPEDGLLGRTPARSVDPIGLLRGPDLAPR
jgi:hypothetical protein